MINEMRINEIKEKLDLWQRRKCENMNNNFLEALKKYRLKEEISMKDLATIDRIEGDYAICELLNGDMVDIPLKEFKEVVSEGDIFNLEVKIEEGQQVYKVKEKNVEEMELRRKLILEKLNKIKNK